MPKILIADDNTNIQRMVALAFEERGMKVVAVGNGEAAVRRLADLDPDLVLADIFMPVRSGYEVCEYIKKDKNFCHIPVILLVGAFDPLDEKEARRVGADGVLKKPFVPPDPLIAMVTAALEKNPRVVAELAKAKQIVVEPAPAPQPEVLKIEPKPLPEFPEPSPEEAALIYGFGRGHRASIEDQDGAESAPPVEPGTEEEFEATDTSHEWQRAAMNFEVPPEEGGRPAFSDDAAFTSDRALPVRDASAIEPGFAPQSTGPNFDFAPDTLAALESQGAAPVPETVAEDAVSAASKDAPQASVAEISVHAAEAPEAAAPATSTPSFASTDEIPAVIALEREEISEERQTQSDGISSNIPHWMDALSAQPSDGGWMAALDQRTEEPKELPAESPEQPANQPLAESEEAHSPLGSLDLSTPMAVIAEGHGGEGHTEQMAAASVSQTTDKYSSGDTAAASAGDSWFAPLPKALNLSSEAAPESINPQEVSEAVAHYPLDLGMKLIAAPANVEGSHREPELDEPPPVRLNPEPLLDAEETDGPTRVSAREPDLVVPSAVRVTPEPLLDTEDEAPSTLHMYSHMGEIPPAYSMHVPPSLQTAAQKAPERPSELAAQPPVEAHDEPLVEPALSSVESSVEEFSERIPTAAPSSPQALQEIPFLTPPPDIDRTTEDSEVSSETVDAVVRKVLEKLEPQLHDLLSQSLLRPLVENMLSGELSKKSR